MNIIFVMYVHYWERVGAMTLAEILRRAGHRVDLVNIYNMKPERYADIVSKYDPDVVAYSVMSPEISIYLEVNKNLKQRLRRPFISVFGGPHPTFFPELVEVPGIDAVCRGEADETILHYMEYLEGRIPADRVPNFWIRQGDKIVRNEVALWPTDLDAIPFADRSLWDCVQPHMAERMFMASRGCPYKCTYCFNRAYNQIYGHPKPVVRRRSVDNLLAEIKQVHTRYPDVLPFFTDDSFTFAPLRWMQEFRDKYPKEIGKPFYCHIRADQVNEEKVRLLAESGCHCVRFGIECGDENYCNTVLDRNLRISQITGMSELLHRYGIRITTLNILALPDKDPLALDKKTLELNVKVRPHYAAATLLHPFPGTVLADYTRKIGLFTDDYASLNDPHCLNTPLKFPKKIKNQLMRQQKLFALAVGIRPVRWMLPVLRRLPLLKFYTLLYWFYGGYCNRFKMSPAKKNWRFFSTIFSLSAKRAYDTIFGKWRTAKPTGEQKAK